MLDAYDVHDDCADCMSVDFRRLAHMTTWDGLLTAFDRVLVMVAVLYTDAMLVEAEDRDKSQFFNEVAALLKHLKRQALETHEDLSCELGYDDREYDYIKKHSG